jgi:hypothetical protein
MACIFVLPEGSASVDRSPTGIYEVLLFLCEWGSQEKSITRTLTSEEISEGRREECVTPCTGRMAQNPATAPTYQTRSDKNFVKPMDRRSSIWLKNSLDSAKRKLKRVFCGSSEPQALQRRNVQQPTLGRLEKKKKLGTCFVWCQIYREYKARKLQGIDWGHVVIASQIWLQYVLKDAHASFPLGFLPRKLRHG